MWREWTPCFPTFVFPLWSSKSDVFAFDGTWLLHFHIWHYLQSKTVSAFFCKATLFVFYNQKLKTALLQSKVVEFYCDNLKTFQNFQKCWHGFELQLFSYKTAKFQTSGWKIA